MALPPKVKADASVRGASFGSFAYWRIRGAVYDLLRRQKKAPLVAVEDGLGVRLHKNGGSVDVSYRADLIVTVGRRSIGAT